MTRTKNELLRYNLGKAIKEHRNARGLTGFELEMDQEARKDAYNKNTGAFLVPSMVVRSFTQASNTGHHSEIQGGVDIVADRGILESLGVTIYDDLKAKLNIVYSEGFGAKFYEENEDADDGEGQEVYGNISPRRIQGFSTFTNEFLASASTTPTLFGDMAGAIEAATAVELFKNILALPALTGFDKAATGKALTYSDVMKLKAALKSLQFANPKFVAGGELFAELETTSKDAGSGLFVIDDSIRISGNGIIDAQGLMTSTTGGKHQLIFGDFSKAHVGYFGGIEILADPYTNSGKGETKITYTRYGDVTVNPYAFKSIQNAIID